MKFYGKNGKIYERQITAYAEQLKNNIGKKLVTEEKESKRDKFIPNIIVTTTEDEVRNMQNKMNDICDTVINGDGDKEEDEEPHNPGFGSIDIDWKLRTINLIGDDDSIIQTVPINEDTNRLIDKCINSTDEKITFIKDDELTEAIDHTINDYKWSVKKIADMMNNHGITNGYPIVNDIQTLIHDIENTAEVSYPDTVYKTNKVNFIDQIVKALSSKLSSMK